MGADRLLVCPLFTFIIRQNAAFVKGFFAGNAVILFDIFVEVQLRFFAWLVFTLIQTAILLSDHHDHKRK